MPKRRIPQSGKIRDSEFIYNFFGNVHAWFQVSDVDFTPEVIANGLPKIRLILACGSVNPIEQIVWKKSG